ncbi:acetamidase/formamidase family protein [Candidatus Clostridium stratigraminis]|uniref:Acetamidase/formamidase family protein n=1 Tax=Candidatus Clostridium stratigraminis TaxID=3381661 RepID=A0ABW8T2J6_9CLOT
MFYKLSKNHHTFTLSKDNAPYLRVNSGDTIEIETLDCFSGQLKTSYDTLEEMDWTKMNPATGPIFINQAKCGDTLKVTINSIDVSGQGVMSAGKSLGPLGDYLDEITTKIIPIIDNTALYDEVLHFGVNPMIGVIGVAPAEHSINTGTPGAFGGNMDNAMITAGAFLYLPVFVDGALFSLGDLHAAMGDGEIGETGVEIAGTVSVKLEIIKDLALNNPVVINEEFFTTIASAVTLDDAVNTSAIDMLMLLSERLDLNNNTIAMLMSAVGSSEICQVVDPLKTARFVMPRNILNKYDFKF